MKKNYFYTTIQEEFSLLLKATQTSFKEEIERLQIACYQRHKALCLHLMRDFITPIAREDLYAVSWGICSVFQSLFSLTEEDRKLAEKSVLLLSAEPFRFDETPLRRREDLWDVWGDPFRRSSTSRECFFSLDSLSERLLLAAVRNA